MKINKIYLGDCIEVMQGFDENSIDSIVTDPPYGLEFMGKEWDKLTNREAFKGSKSGKGTPFARNYSTPCFYYQKGEDIYNFHYKWATECLRVLKPGGHLLSFGGTRTYHRMVCAIEDAGFEIRDTLQWIFGQGFPKSLDISKQIDKMKGAKRETYMKPIAYPDSDCWGIPNKNKALKSTMFQNGSRKMEAGMVEMTLPSTPEAKQWDGWGTGLKPACEMICLARKPISEKNIALNVLKWGTGGINIDGGRIETSGRPLIESKSGKSKGIYGNGLNNSKAIGETTKGRFPSNVLLDEEAAELLDEMTQNKLHAAGSCSHRNFKGWENSGELQNANIPNDSGGASRFFKVFDNSRFRYISKASKSERNAGLEGFEEKKVYEGFGSENESGKMFSDKPILMKCTHPTVKPIKLMRYLVRLITPPNGICLDPFVGSGTTPIACIEEGFDYIAIEKEKEYFDIAEKRIFHYKRELKLF